MPRSETTAPARFSVRGVQLARAAFAAIAAIMITFSGDHSAPVGLAIFSGFAIATGLILAISAWLTYPTGRRSAPVLLAAISIVAGMSAGIPTLRTVTMFFVVVIAWALLSGFVELMWGLRERRRDDVPAADARDAVTVGIFGLLLGVALLFVRTDFALDYVIAEVGESYTLTGITIAVGVFGAYAAIVAVYLAIAAFSPRVKAVREDEVSEERV